MVPLLSYIIIDFNPKNQPKVGWVLQLFFFFHLFLFTGETLMSINKSNWGNFYIRTWNFYKVSCPGKIIGNSENIFAKISSWFLPGCNGSGVNLHDLLDLKKNLALALAIFMNTMLIEKVAHAHIVCTCIQIYKL